MTAGPTLTGGVRGWWCEGGGEGGCVPHTSTYTTHYTHTSTYTHQVERFCLFPVTMGEESAGLAVGEPAAVAARFFLLRGHIFDRAVR